MSQTWLIRGALTASALALLATSAPNVPYRSYAFERSVAGEAVSLTREQPSALFVITIRADSLGPDDVVSTDDATVRVRGDIVARDLEGETPAISVLAGSNQLEARESFDTTLPLLFEGTCDAPAENAPCQASFTLQLARDDDGTRQGSLEVEWSLELTSNGLVEGEGEDRTGLDPPWTVQVEHP